MASPTVPILSVLVQPKAGTNASKFGVFFIFLALKGAGLALF